MPGPELPQLLDILGQQPGLSFYPQLSLCFPVSDTSSHPSIIETLTTGLERLSTHFPWVAGQVVNEGSSEGNTGIYKIASFKKALQLVVKDLTGDASAPTMDALRRADFPMHMFDEQLVAPRRTIPSPSERLLPQPVLMLQATFIPGGIILTVMGQHQVMDVTGQGQLMYLLHKACRGEPFTAEEVEVGNHVRGEIVPLFDDSYELGDEVDRWTVKPASTPVEGAAPLMPTPKPKATWVNFSFSPASLSSLKAHATSTLPQGASYISTDDALSSLLFISVLRARLPRLEATTQTTFARAVDIRRYLSIPSTYPRVVQGMTYHSYALHQLLKEPLGAFAHALRVFVDPHTSQLAHSARLFATALFRSPNKRLITSAATLDPSKDIMLSSWAKERCYEWDFGMRLGTPEAVRRPRFAEVESLIYLLPKTREGEIVAAVCLRVEDLERLRADGEFMRFGTYIG